MLKAPIPYSASLEKPEAGEAETIKGIEEALLGILETTSADYGHAVRSVHAKSHGLLEAELEVLADLPPELAQGLFARPGRYPAIMRFSTNPGDVLHDSISVPRGLAVKLLGVEGERLPDAEGTSQDFILVNGPAFVASSAKQFLGNLKLLAKTTDRAEWAKRALSAVLRGAETAIEAFGSESATLKALGGAPNVHPLGETYYSQSAFRYGDHVAKFSLTPVSHSLKALGGTVVDLQGQRNGIREAVIREMAVHGGEWELRVQLCRDAQSMPVEDPSVRWDETASPFLPVARLRAQAQTGWSDERAQVVDDNMRFSVWTGLEAHRPLGVINRVRKQTYAASARFRGTFNGCPIHEPAGDVHLPG
ncbi:catalase family protein [Terrihabitans rhizophilus]|uniref:Catalase family protein n=1 Tax=Terrihabitans rhizophilus TaxID=3092662 RepID=A0ABU4RXK3_9HYPH|nr:catalase family protein [Terrihabitans sp. PJ23]MDX6807646.1 catalase family protein [Terrihabitans sp. PJ23]